MLTFAEPDHEAAFKDFYQCRLPQINTKTFFVGSLMTGYALGNHLPYQLSREDNAYQWERHDPRTLVFSGYLAVATSCVLGIFISQLVHRKVLRSLDMELISVALLCIIGLCTVFANPFYIVHLFDADPHWTFGKKDPRSTHPYVLLTIDCIMTAASLFLPLRASVAWVLHVSLVISVSALHLAVKPGASAGAMPLFMGSLGFFAFVGQWQNEQRARQQWGDLRDSEDIVQEQKNELSVTSELMSGMEKIAESLCTVFLKLGADIQILGEDKARDALFGQPLQGKVLDAVLSETDRSRFHACLQRSQGAPQRLNITFQRNDGPLEAILVVVQVCVELTTYIVGICTTEEIPLPQFVDTDGVPSEAADMETVQCCAKPSNVLSSHDTRCTAPPHLEDALSFASSSAITFHTGLHGAHADTKLQAFHGFPFKTPNEMTQVYKQLERVARGQQGTIFRCQRISDNSIFALKKVDLLGRLPRVEFARKMKNVEREIRSLKYVSACSPHVIWLEDYWFTPDFTLACLVMEYLPSNLDLEIRKRRKAQDLFPSQQIFSWLADLVQGLDAIHKSGIIHRDLKPSNVLLFDRGAQSYRGCKIADFGVARSLRQEDGASPSTIGASTHARLSMPEKEKDHQTESYHREDTPYTRAPGTAFYSSPEMVRGEVYGQRSDIFSLGCLLYEITSLERLFGVENDGFMKLQSGDEPPALNAEKYACAEDITRLCNWMLKFQPEQRPDTASLKNDSVLQPYMIQPEHQVFQL